MREGAMLASRTRKVIVGIVTLSIASWLVDLLEKGTVLVLGGIGGIALDRRQVSTHKLGRSLQKPAIRRLASAEDAPKDRPAATGDAVFQVCVDGICIAGNRFEKYSAPPTFSTAVGRVACNKGLHCWRLKRLAGSGFRTRLGVCLGNITSDANPVFANSKSSFWFYEDISGSLCRRIGAGEKETVASDMPLATYPGDELAILLDCEEHAVYFYWPSGQSGSITGLPKKSSFRLFISLDSVGDAWEVFPQDVSGGNQAAAAAAAAAGETQAASTMISEYVGNVGNAVASFDMDVGQAIRKAKELNDEYNISGQTTYALGELFAASGAFASQAVDKAVEVNAKYQITDRIKATIEEQLKKSR
eukprot:TRINITY_DN14335_c0_g1_i1.p1 TRINITY_DN14335_c0_g1~~TRINITY_DN14335_c0_g1_i1.p1  ORF type:complete len:361 (+),score=66.68 TRINITY_DN14335_c0_g1_i1:36-1118(+)